ncbi:MAG: hypothetical protein J6Y78_15355 [Paludibacteraceae bacterium]|nr:hypothetical protein [Paludibacteraceae bacterium]
MADKKVVAWFTMNGKHIPIYEGESKDDAVKRSVTQGSKQGVTAHEHPSKEKKYGIRQFTPNKIGVYYGDEKIGEVDSKEKAEQLMNQHKAKADTSNKNIDKKSQLVDPDGKYGKKWDGITSEDADMAMKFINSNPTYKEAFNLTLANGTDEQFNGLIKSMAKNAKDAAKKKEIAKQNEDIKDKQIAQAQAERDRLNGKKSEYQLKDSVKKSFDGMSEKELDHYSKAYVKNVKTLSEKIDKSTDPKEKAWLSEHLEKIKAEQDYINSKIKSGSKEKSNVLFKFDWDKLPGSATAHGEMVKYLKKHNIDWFNTPYFDLVANVDGDGNYYKLDHKGNGVVGIDRSKAYKKKG